MRSMLWIGVVLMATLTDAILNPQISNQKRTCYEVNQQLMCNCFDSHLKVLNITTFQFLDVHNSVNKITVMNCFTVIIHSDVIKNLRSLRHLDINNVENLELRERSLHWEGYYTDAHTNPLGIIITIKNSTLTQVAQHALGGRPAELHFLHTQLNNLQPFAVSSQARMNRINIEHCKFRNINLQAFKKLQTEYFIINNSTFLEIPSRSFNEIDVLEDFKITNSRFQTVRSNAFIVKRPKRFEILNSYFNNLENDAFVVETTGNVIINNNNFTKLHDKAFLGISFIKENRNTPAKELTFDGNRINDIKKDSLNFNRTSFSPRYGTIYLNQSCSCVNIKTWLSNNEWKENIQCINDEKKKTTIKATVFNSKVCESGSKLWIILVAVFSVLFILLIVGIIVAVILYRRYKKRKQKENNRERNKVPVGLIVPDGRTYRETEVHVIVEKAELLTTEL